MYINPVFYCPYCINRDVCSFSGNYYRNYADTYDDFRSNDDLNNFDDFDDLKNSRNLIIFLMMITYLMV